MIQLENAVHLANQRELTYQGATELITGSRDATREAFNRGLITNGETWMEMIKSRNKTSHTYDLNVAEDIVEKIRNLFSTF